MLPAPMNAHHANSNATRDFRQLTVHVHLGKKCRYASTHARVGANAAQLQLAPHRGPLGILRRYVERTTKNSAQTGAVRPIASLDTTDSHVNAGKLEPCKFQFGIYVARGFTVRGASHRQSQTTVQGCMLQVDLPPVSRIETSSSDVA